ncbi:MAG: hypothetical protein JXR96_01295 [Deltaproteobacteria bacterium]|nr:hypothetical protein [Deltaproteobacteria bacterium]
MTDFRVADIAVWIRSVAFLLVTMLSSAACSALLLASCAPTRWQCVRFFPRCYLSEVGECGKETPLDTSLHASEMLWNLGEPIIRRDAPAGISTFRLLWMRMYHNTIVVRIELDSHGEGTLAYKVTRGHKVARDGEDDEAAIERKPPSFGRETMVVVRIEEESDLDDGRFEIEREGKRPLSRRETEAFMRLVDEKGYWDMRAIEKFSFEPVYGSNWFIEAASGNRYHLVHRWSPKEGGEVRELGLYMITMAGLKIDEVY